MLSLLDDAITIPATIQGRWRKHFDECDDINNFDECTVRADQTPGLRRETLAVGKLQSRSLGEPTSAQPPDPNARVAKSYRSGFVNLEKGGNA